MPVRSSFVALAASSLSSHRGAWRDLVGLSWIIRIRICVAGLLKPARGLARNTGRLIALERVVALGNCWKLVTPSTHIERRNIMLADGADLKPRALRRQRSPLSTLELANNRSGQA